MATGRINPEPERNGRKPRGRDREPVALFLAAGWAIADAAREARVSDRCVYLWLQDSAFVNRVRELRNAIYERAVGRLADLSETAADVLATLLEGANDQVKLGAVRTALEFGLRLREQVELATRMTALEKAVAGNDVDVGQTHGGGGPGSPGPGSAGAGDTDRTPA
jgi:hypothetical protein